MDPLESAVRLPFERVKQPGLPLEQALDEIADHVCFKPVAPDKSTDMRIVELLAPRNWQGRLHDRQKASDPWVRSGKSDVN